MNNTRTVGRIGVLALTVGIGYAVTGAPASADTTDTSGMEGVSSAPPARQARAARANAPHPSPRRAAVSSPVAEQIPDIVAAPHGAAAVRPARGPRAVEQSVTDDSAPPVSAAPAAAYPIGALAGQGAKTSTPVPAAISAPSAAAPPGLVLPTPDTAANAPVAAPVVGRRGPVTPLPAAATAQLVSAALAPLVGGGTPGAPGQAPLLWTLMSWARREFGRLFPAHNPAAVTTTGQVQSPNLLVNPGAELGDPSLSGMSAVSIPGWTVAGTPTVIPYGAGRTIWSTGLPFPVPDLPSIWSFPKSKNGPADGGNQFFGGGNVADATISQTVDLTGAGTTIDGGNVAYHLGAWLGGYSFDPSAASVTVTFLDANKEKIGTGRIGPVTAWDRLFAINLLQRSTTGTLPTGTRYAQVEVIFDDKNPIHYGFNADYNDAFADNISFTVGTDVPAPPPPAPIASTPPGLDHVFMVYMENKGYHDIAGSPNAPYLNSLMNTYGLADNYYALTHGSSPNYYPIIGGTDYGITYNCKTACIDAPADQTLTGRLDLAGKTWRGYSPNGTPSGAWDNESADVLLNFTSIVGDPAYAAAHILPVEQMAIDLQSPATAPNFAWIFPDAESAGEGTNKLRFYLNQLMPGHQYDVPALDQYLSRTVPTVLTSPVWTDPTQKSVMVITFDEDTNNISLGFGNEGNHVVTVIIPSQGAIAAGMKGGAFTAVNQYNHYSLLRFIEDSLGVAPITNNDKYATPMNEFWTQNPGTTSGSVPV